MAEDSISILGYGGAGSGKSTLGTTGPQPTLWLDSETGSRFLPRARRQYWNPSKGEPVPDTSNGKDLVVVRISKWDDVEPVMKYLRSHRHPFKSVVFDSISEVLVKAKESISQDAFQIREWGELSQKMGSLFRELRDIAADPDSSIQVLYMISIAKYSPATEKTKEKWEPYLEGSVKNVAPYLFDITALVSLEDVLVDPNNPFGEKKKAQTFYTGSGNSTIVAKSRVPGLPEMIQDLTLQGLFRGIFGEDVAPEPAPAVVEPTPPPTPQTPPASEPEKPKTTPKKSSGVPTLPPAE